MSDNDSSEVTMGGQKLFTLLTTSPVEISTPIMPSDPEPPKKKRGRPKKENTDNIIRATGEVVSDTIHTYNETNVMLKQTLLEVDTLASDLKTELDNVRSSKTLRNKYTYIGDLSSNIGSLLSTKIQAIRELNNSIKASNDMDYRRQKDLNMLNAQDDDQRIFDMYNAFVNTPISAGITLGPNTTQMSLVGSENIIRESTSGGNTLESGFQNFQQNMTPAQRLMVMEDQIHDVLVYDKATGQKYFDKVDKNGNSVPGIERRDPMFLEDYTIDTRNRIARNVNINDTMPLIILNENKKLGEY